MSSNTILDKIPGRGDSSTSGSPNTKGFKPSRFAAKLLTVAAVLAFVWFFRPWFHTLIYGIRYSPGMMIGIGLPIALALILFLAPPLGDGATSSFESKATIFGVFLVLFMILGLILGVAAGMVEQRTMAENTMDNVEYVDEPPVMNADNPRIAPRSVSDTQTAGTLSFPQHQLGTSDIARAEDGSLTWSYALEPDQFRNQFSDQQIGLVHADMNAMENRDIETYDDHAFEHGQNMRLWDNVDWQIKKQDGYWSAYHDDPYEFIHDGEAYIAYPKTGHEWHLTPIPHTTPTWEGVALVHQDGTVEHLSPEEAQERPELDGQRIYPLHNSKEYSEALVYRNGIANTLPAWGQFEGVVEPASMPSGVGNDQPFVVDMEGERMNYVYAMEAAGGDSGLSEVWFFDAETGEPVAYDTGSANVFGPERAIGIAKGTDTQTEWGSDGEAMAVEPILVTVDGDLYWHVKVVTSGQDDVVRNIFVSASDENVGADPDEAAEDAVVMHNTQDVRDFIGGEIDEDDLESGEEATIEEPTDEERDDGIAYYIVIQDENGEVVDRIPVEEGHETVIDSSSEEPDDEDNE